MGKDDMSSRVPPFAESVDPPQLSATQTAAVNIALNDTVHSGGGAGNGSGQATGGVSASWTTEELEEKLRMAGLEAAHVAFTRTRRLANGSDRTRSTRARDQSPTRTRERPASGTNSGMGTRTNSGGPSPPTTDSSDNMVLVEPKLSAAQTAALNMALRITNHSEQGAETRAPLQEKEIAEKRMIAGSTTAALDCPTAMVQSCPRANEDAAKDLEMQEKAEMAAMMMMREQPSAPPRRVSVQDIENSQHQPGTNGLSVNNLPPTTTTNSAAAPTPPLLMRPGAYHRRPGESAERRQTFHPDQFSAACPPPGSNLAPAPESSSIAMGDDGPTGYTATVIEEEEESGQVNSSAVHDWSTTDATTRSSSSDQQQQQPRESRQGLVEAQLVSERKVFRASQLELAEIHQEEFQEEYTKRRRRSLRKNAMVLGFGALVLGLFIVFLGLVLGLKSSSSKDSTSSPDNDNIDSTESNTTTSFPPSVQVTEFLLSGLPSYTRDTIRNDFNGTSPQSRAYAWTLQDPNFNAFSIHRLLQRYALATFFYSTHGESWNFAGNVNATGTVGPTDVDVNGSVWLKWENQSRPPPPLDGLTSALPPQQQQQPSDGLGSMPPPPPDTSLPPPGQQQQQPLDGSGPLPPPPPDTSLPPPSDATRPGVPPHFVGGRVVDALWLSHDKHECVWFNVNHFEQKPVCNSDGLYIHWYLPRNEMRGRLPPELALLTNLATFALPINTFTGTLPVQLFEAWSNMVYINLDDNQLTGSLPTEIGLWTNLEAIRLGSNRLEGFIPWETLATIPQLTHMNLARNHLIGSLPSEIAKMSGLRHLELKHASLKHSGIPTELGLLTGLKALYLGDTELSSTIPSEMGLLVGLKELELEGNPDLHGSIPTELGNLARNLTGRLDDVEIEGTSLTGTIPPEWCENLLFLTYDCSASLRGCDAFPCE